MDAQTTIYIVMQVCQIVSFLAYLVVGYYLLSSPKEFQKSLHFHAISTILIVNFIQVSYDLSLTLQYLKTGTVLPATDANCLAWTFIDSTTYYGSLFFMTWLAFERHLLIFYSNLFSTRRRRFLFHYLPMIIIGIYTIAYYFAVDFLYPCVNTFDHSLSFCGFICYMNLPTPNLYSIELIIHQVVPTILIAFLSLTLIIRVVLARQRLRQSTEWQKYRKMIIQLLCISATYMLFTTPFSLNPIAQGLGLPAPFSYEFYATYLAYWSYGICITLPLIMCFSLPNLTSRFNPLFHTCFATRVQPMA